MRVLKWLFISLLLVGLVLIGIWRLSRSRSFQIAGELVTRIETDKPVVALTFDDGPTPAGVEWALTLADSLDFVATFFLTGSELEQHPDLAPRLLAQGHQIANHTYSHPRMVFRSPSFVRHEIESTDSLIRAAGWRDEILFRPPYSMKFVTLPLYLARHDRPVLLWDIEPESYPDVAGTPEGIAEHVLERVQPGSIILLHIMYGSRESSRAAVPLVVAGLRARGFSLVTVGELMKIGNQGL